MPPEPLTPEQITAAAPSRARLKFIADALKSYSAVLTGAAVVTPAFAGHTLGGINVAWAIVGVLLLAVGVVMVPGE